MTDHHPPRHAPPSSPAPSSPEPSSPEPSPLLSLKLELLAAGVLLALGLGMAVFYLVTTQSFDPRAAAGHLGAAAARTESAGAPGAGQASGEPADEEPGPYVPSSAYIEPGADSRELQFGFGAAEGRAGGQGDSAGGWIMSNDTIQSVMSHNQHELIGCYADALQDDPELMGKVDFEFAVAPDGHVAMVRVTRSTLRSQAAEDCFVERARHWRFPPTDQELLTRFETDFAFAAY